MILVTGATGHVGRAVVCRLASLGHDVSPKVATAKSPGDFPALTGQEPESFRDFLLRATSGSPDCIAGSPFRERHRS